VSRAATLAFLGDLLRGHLKKIRSRWGKLPPGRIAAIVLAVLRHDQRLADMAGGNNISATPVRRWVMEVIELLATRAERLDRALEEGHPKGWPRRPDRRHPDPHPAPHRSGQPPQLQRETQGPRPSTAEPGALP
jgi:hypothetical protein